MLFVCCFLLFFAMQIGSKKRAVGRVHLCRVITHVDLRWKRVFLAFRRFNLLFFRVQINSKKRVVGRVSQPSNFMIVDSVDVSSENC